MTLKQSSAVHIPASYSADVILFDINYKLRLLVINLASVPGGQLVNSPTAQSLERYRHFKVTSFSATMQDKDILNFWKWFIANKDKLESDSYNPPILQQLDKTISSWGLDWEIGPGQSKVNSLTISPKGSPVLLQLTEQIISKAPELDKWQFYSTKQPKVNWHLLKLNQDNISVNASEWKYVLLKYDDEKIEVLIKADDLLKYDKETKELIVEIVLMNLLGERMFMERVDYFDVVDKFDSENGITEIKYLPKHLDDKSFFE